MPKHRILEITRFSSFSRRFPNFLQNYFFLKKVVKVSGKSGKVKNFGFWNICEKLFNKNASCTCGFDAVLRAVDRTELKNKGEP
jgi:hypothetical protein